MKTVQFDDVRYPGEQNITNLIHVFGVIIWLFIGAVALIMALKVSIWVSLFYAAVVIGYFLVWPLIVYNATIQGNGVLVSQDQYPEIQKIINEFQTFFQLESREMPEVYIIQERGFNAFTFSALSHNRIVILSDLVESLSEKNNWEELKIVVVHELAHHIARHPDFWLLDYPTTFFPFNLLKYYQSRLGELTADRVAYICSGSLEITKSAFYKLIAGPKLAHEFNENAYQNQIKSNASSFVLKIVNLFNTHPYFTKRMEELEKYDQKIQQLNK
jgi:Zn-dependent protease with chaperone function